MSSKSVMAPIGTDNIVAFSVAMKVSSTTQFSGTELFKFKAK
jgi:hypothetical protein